MRKSIDFATLKDDARENIRAKLPPGSVPDDGKPAPTPARSRAGAKRKATGDSFERELDLAHQVMASLAWGKVRRNHVPTMIIGHGDRGAKRVAKGKADVDYSGWVVLADTRANYGPERIVPVAFDAKVQPEGSGREGWYQHDPELKHQLESLQQAAHAGEYAFLLVLVRDTQSGDRIYALPIGEYFDALATGEGVQLFYWLGSERRDVVPSVGRFGEPISLNWIRLLPQVFAL